MTYKIKYNYRTGNSFGYNDAEDILELEWNDLAIAKENLQRINEHYAQYLSMAVLWRSKAMSNQEIIRMNKDKDWIVIATTRVAFTGDNFQFVIDDSDTEKYAAQGYRIGNWYDEMASENQIRLYADNGNVWQFWAPWCGYFEALYSAEIVGKTDDDLKITFK